MQAENDELNDKDRHICYRDGGHLVAAEKPDHEGIQKAEGCGDKVLDDDRQRQQEEMLVKAFGLMQIGEHVDLRYFRIIAWGSACRDAP